MSQNCVHILFYCSTTFYLLYSNFNTQIEEDSYRLFGDISDVLIGVCSWLRTVDNANSLKGKLHKLFQLPIGHICFRFFFSFCLFM